MDGKDGGERLLVVADSAMLRMMNKEGGEEGVEVRPCIVAKAPLAWSGWVCLLSPWPPATSSPVLHSPACGRHCTALPLPS